ncbi:MAG: hypothetical protein LKG48_09520 [Lachnospiraceae bacterium]|jgi:hypothetical protein|nr:hypothetical protein [Lachnospiraceae bacterium]MCI1334478.1 hypothetical protein [Lachnospiraceae bacterium]MCI1358751.1 hypothetical protein [Lachnospiraceae bacterium]MCI1379353.1 hypothetical protein [Lachnospiraceae bacterium]MCI1455495.1 hypothetical protein [Lachnospiraceae bacterium]
MNKNSRKALIIFFMVALLSAAAFWEIIFVKILSPQVNNIFFLVIWGMTWMTDLIVIIAEPTYDCETRQHEESLQYRSCSIDNTALYTFLLPQFAGIVCSDRYR